MKLILLAILALGLSGCAVRTFNRYDPATGKVVQRQWVGTCLLMGEAATIDSSTQDGPFTYRLKVGALKGRGDADMLKALYEAGMAAGMKAAKP